GRINHLLDGDETTYLKLYPTATNSGTKMRGSEWKGNGSGFFIDYRGYIATNHHVVKDANEIEVEFIRNSQRYAFKVEVIQSDKQNDLAILKIIDNSFNFFESIPYNFQSSLSDVGTNVFALGYPMTNIMGSEIKFTDGKVSSKTGIQGDITMYQISVPIQAGNSGGALFDYDGNLIGITSAGLNRDYFNSENVNYAIKTSYLKNLIDVLPVSIQLPNDKTIATKTLTEKIKILSDYVVLIKIK
ncbi:MAG: serine protease, partial [Bacteroidaceae bacterium]|nr:serine protease [Bacteroidaceae bacterium]